MRLQRVVGYGVFAAVYVFVITVTVFAGAPAPADVAHAAQAVDR